jgi:hypothetical protein
LKWILRQPIIDKLNDLTEQGLTIGQIVRRHYKRGEYFLIAQVMRDGEQVDHVILSIEEAK